jgi:hypothetical protein
MCCLCCSLLQLPPKLNLLLYLVSALITRSTNDLQRLLPSFCEGFGVDPKFLTGLIALSKRDYSGLAEFAQRFGACDPRVIEQFIGLLGHLNVLSVSRAAPSGAIAAKLSAAASGAGLDSAANALSAASPTLSAAARAGVATASAAGPGGGLSYKELFQLADTDKTASLSFSEFMNVLKYISLPLSQSVALRIFSGVERGDGTIGQEE